MRWSAVISLPLRHRAYVVARSVSNLFTAKHLVARLNAVKNRIAMAPNVKGFALETFLSGKFPLWYFQFSPLASPHDSVQMWADPAATTIILLCVCLEVWCISLFIVVYILMTSSICVILFGCCSLTNFRAQSLTNHVYCRGLCSELRQCNGIYFKHRISEVILTWVMY